MATAINFRNFMQLENVADDLQSTTALYFSFAVFAKQVNSQK